MTSDLLLFYDFETTGLPDFSAPSSSAHQPHIVQVAALLVEEGTRKTVANINLVVKPDGWSIPAAAASLHGITTGRAAEVGVEESAVVSLLLNLWKASVCRVGHNESFDARIMRIALKRYTNGRAADEWKAGMAHCTARLSRPLCMLPKNKMPTLAEAYMRLCGKVLQEAHTAQADTEACMAVYWAASHQGMAQHG